MIMVGQYFDRHRSVALGIAAAGGSFGQLIIPLIIRFLLDQYGYQGCMLIYSGIVLNGVVAGALLRPQSFYKRRKSNLDGNAVKLQGIAVAEQISHTPSHSVNSLVFRTEIQDSLTSTPVNALDGMPRVAMLENMEETILNSGPEVLDQGARISQDNDGGHQRSRAAVEETDKNRTEVPDDERDVSANRCDDEQEQVHLAVQYRSTGSIQVVNVQSDHANGADCQAAEEDNPTDIENILHRPENCCVKCCTGCLRPFTNLFDRAFLCRYVFWVYIVAVSLANAGYIDQFIFLPPYAKEIGISKMHTAAILAASGVADLIGRVAGGMFNSLRLLKVHIFTSLTLFVTGVSILVLLVFASYTSVMLHGIFLGLVGGMYIAMVPIVLMQLVGLTKFPQAFAFTMLCVGCTNLTLPSLLGKCLILKCNTSNVCILYTNFMYRRFTLSASYFTS